jgi:hypothetical protein
MKTKQITKQRSQERSFETAMLDCKLEYDELISNDILDEIAFAEICDDDE